MKKSEKDAWVQNYKDEMDFVLQLVRLKHKFWTTLRYNRSNVDLKF